MTADDPALTPRTTLGAHPVCCGVEWHPGTRTCIVDSGTTIEERARVGAVVSARRRVRDQDITLIGAGSTVGTSSDIGPGERLEPGTDT